MQKYYDASITLMVDDKEPESVSAYDLLDSKIIDSLVRGEIENFLEEEKQIEHFYVLQMGKLATLLFLSVIFIIGGAVASFGSIVNGLVLIVSGIASMFSCFAAANGHRNWFVEKIKAHDLAFVYEIAMHYSTIVLSSPLMNRKISVHHGPNDGNGYSGEFVNDVKILTLNYTLDSLMNYRETGYNVLKKFKFPMVQYQSIGWLLNNVK